MITEIFISWYNKIISIMDARKILIFAAALIIVITVQARESEGIVPLPVSQSIGHGNFKLGIKSRIITNRIGKDVSEMVAQLNSYLSFYYGFNPLTLSEGNKAEKGSIFLFLDESKRMKKEEYKISVRKDGITISASAPNGLFYGIQSLMQLMPAKNRKQSHIKIKCTEISDYPRFSWRGLHLDVCRHFMPKEFIFKYLDYMAIHKLNTFHFHLTDDQGWRIEIKKYPLLTEIGSVRSETSTGSSGFFTQEDIKEIVEYASKRYITVVPEIEMPGHALAALSAYPQLGCTGGPYRCATTWGVFDDVMCAGKESTFTFLENVIDEVVALFPSEYIHVGGDECPKARWHECPDCQKRMVDENLKNENQLQSYFVHRMERYINNKGRKIIGWDEILEGGLAPNAAVMSWRGEAGGVEAAGLKHYVVMTPGDYCYLDHYQGDPKTEPLAIGGFTPLKKIYNYEPVPAALSEENANYVMGAQGNVWTEYMSTTSYVEYMVYPRAAALAEVLWSPKETRDYNSFMKRMRQMIKRYKVIGLNYCPNEF